MWRPSRLVPQFLRNGDHVRDEIVFYHDSFNASVFALGHLVNRFTEKYATWGFCEEGVLADYGHDDADLLAFLAKLQRRGLSDDCSAPH